MDGHNTQESAMSRFKAWMKLMGFNGKQVTEAGKALSVNSYNTVKNRMIDKDDLHEAELLAMSALRLGIKPWSEDYDEELQRMKRLLEAIKEAA